MALSTFDGEYQNTETMSKQRDLGCSVPEHCPEVTEKNVISKPGPTSAPTPAPTPAVLVPPTTDRVDGPTIPVNPACTSDKDGNFGFTDVLGSLEVNYRYQVETSQFLTAGILNEDVLPQQLEKSISDLIVPALFFPDGFCEAPISLSSSRNSRTKKIVFLNGGSRQRLLQSTSDSQPNQDLAGLTTSPPDQTMDGDVSCPFPDDSLGDGAEVNCFVVQGGVTVYGSGDINWVESEIHQTLESSMNNGDLDELDLDVLRVRYIPNDYDLNPDRSDRVVDPDPTGELRATTPAWSWVLVGFGALAIIGTVVYMMMSSSDDERDGNEPVYYGRGRPGNDSNSGSDREIYNDDEDSHGRHAAPKSWTDVPDGSHNPNESMVSPVLDEEQQNEYIQ